MTYYTRMPHSYLYNRQCVDVSDPCSGIVDVVASEQITFWPGSSCSPNNGEYLHAYIDPDLPESPLDPVVYIESADIVTGNWQMLLNKNKRNETPFS